MEEKFKLHIDKIGYKDKKLAQKEVGIIKVRLQGKSPPVEVPLEVLVEELQKGKSVSPSVMKGTKEKDFIEQQVFMVDIDNKRTDIPILTVEEALSICEKNHLPLAFYYFSFSHTEKLAKYRLVFVMDEIITDPISRDTIMQKLIELFEQADTSCTNADRIFFGTNKEAKILDLKARITIDTVLKIPPKSAIVKKTKTSGDKELIVKKTKTSRADKELEELINKFDFFSYLKKRNGELERETSRYAMFKTCEICGHHNDLVYFKDTNIFCCFGAGRKKGGNIIDYLKKVYKLTTSKAIEKFKKELCKKMPKELELICMDDIEEQEVKWLWYPFIPAGKVTILQGDPRKW